MNVKVDMLDDNPVTVSQSLYQYNHLFPNFGPN